MEPESFKSDQKFNQQSDIDFRVEWFSGTGAGGQKRNKSQSSCRVIHIPTGLIETRQGRSRENNFSDAKEALIQLLNNAGKKQNYLAMSTERKQQMGSGMRGDKIITYRLQDDIVTDHRNNKKASVHKVLAGHISLLN